METQNPATPLPTKIIITGDIAIDWYQYPVKPQNIEQNWRFHAAFHSAVKAGGALMLTEFIKNSADASEAAVEIISPVLPADIRSIPPEAIIHSNAILDEFPDPMDKKKKQLRVSQSLGYMGPIDGKVTSFAPEPNAEKADIIVLDDAGNSFRDDAHSWPAALKGSENPLIIYKMSRPLAQGKLWEHVNTLSPKNLIVIISAKDLRETQGVNISKSLSWERTAKDFVYQVQRLDQLSELKDCPFLIVLFGTDGAILYRGGDGGTSVLVFDPKLLEGSFENSVPGNVIGLTALFTATLVTELAKNRLPGIEAGIKKGLSATRVFLETGYKLVKNGIAYPTEIFASPEDHRGDFHVCQIEPSGNLRESDANYWRILDQKTKNTRLLVAEDIAATGKAGGLEGVPMVKFGALAPIDRREIEQLAAIRGLIEEFLANPKPQKPLCFAVFGPPGSGKSFGVKQVLKSINSKNIESITFNISQFAGYPDLVVALHKVRDLALQGKIPFVFFDEFDSKLGDQALGWLQYFLAPMQDGEFKDGDTNHPIGKAIFVFAGGTKDRYTEFDPLHSEEASAGAALEKRSEEFKKVKGPDFVSRLRGYIDIMGPDRQDTATGDDDVFVIRRARLLNVMLQLEPTAQGLFDDHGKLRIDDGIRRAFLHISKYKHGARSISALFEMSRLAGKKRFDLSALPAKEQLELHVDANEFLFLAKQERFQAMFRKRDFFKTPGSLPFIENENLLLQEIAFRLHNAYLKHTGQQEIDRAAYETVSEDFKQSNYDAAEDWPRKLRLINYGIRKLAEGEQPNTPDITDEEVEMLAEEEHERWCNERQLQGWKFCEEKDTSQKGTPHLIPYEELPEDIKEYDRKMVYSFPLIMRELGYELYRMVEFQQIEDTYLTENLAKLLHQHYVEQRTAAGETYETNESLVDWEKLHENKQNQNRDNAGTIPRKLKTIGYDIRRVQEGDEPTMLQLNADDVEKLAKWEHTRWNWKMIFEGWTYKEGPKDEKNKTTPYLVPWDKLSEKIKEYDREPVRLIPEMLKQAGYEAVKEKHA